MSNISLPSNVRRRRNIVALEQGDIRVVEYQASVYSHIPETTRRSAHARTIRGAMTVFVRGLQVPASLLSR